MLERSYVGTHHWMSKRHLHRYCNEIVGRLNTGHNTLRLIDVVIAGMIGKRLTYKALTKS